MTNQADFRAYPTSVGSYDNKPIQTFLNLSYWKLLTSFKKKIFFSI